MAKFPSQNLEWLPHSVSLELVRLPACSLLSLITGSLRLAGVTFHTQQCVMLEPVHSNDSESPAAFRYCTGNLHWPQGGKGPSFPENTEVKFCVCDDGP